MEVWKNILARNIISVNVLFNIPMDFLSFFVLHSIFLNKRTTFHILEINITLLIQNYTIQEMISQNPEQKRKKRNKMKNQPTVNIWKRSSRVFYVYILCFFCFNSTLLFFGSLVFLFLFFFWLLSNMSITVMAVWLKNITSESTSLLLSGIFHVWGFSHSLIVTDVVDFNGKYSMENHDMVKFYFL